MPTEANPPRKRKQPPRPRHVPLRTCIACRQSRPKRELIRVVRTPDGHVLLDPTGKKSGRGAYLCARRSCWEPALRKGRLEHEFRQTLSPEDRAALEAYIDTLPVEPPASAARARQPVRESAARSPKPRKAPAEAQTPPPAGVDGAGR